MFNLKPKTEKGETVWEPQCECGCKDVIRNKEGQLVCKKCGKEAK